MALCVQARNPHHGQVVPFCPCTDETMAVVVGYVP